ncbi:SRPBCC family protein [Streptomyces sp. NPDC001941]|uniref:SRPBCC family protein n=1 Tax=Streptomyces sp. NPDC001941 TaxID=3154659 RepID=UPI003324D6E4
MEHEVFVPVPEESLRRVLRDPARAARCVPGLQRDADGSAGPLAGRLRLRAGGQTITYRGALTLTERDGAFLVAGEGAEARGSGAVKLDLTLRTAPADGGTTLTLTGTARADGRLAELDPDTARSAGRRLLERVAVALGEEASAERPGGEDEPGTGEAPGTDDAQAAGAEAPESEAPREEPEAPGEESGRSAASVFDAPVPPPSLDRYADQEFDVDLPDELPAEAAHARRTMIGRSAEEVDHAPPRGRYAPAPAPSAATTGSTLRWVAPAAAFAVASAVVVGRVLRRRK